MTDSNDADRKLPDPADENTSDGESPSDVVDLGLEDSSDSSLPPSSAPEDSNVERPESYGVAKPEIAPDATAEPCPNCGSPMPGDATLVCLRCGFDMKSMKIIETATGVEETVAPSATATLSSAGRGGMKVPTILAAVAGGILLIGYLLGFAGLFFAPAGAVEGEAFDITIGMRFTGIGTELVRVFLFSVCGCVSLLLLGYLLGKPMGDLRICAIRVLAIVVVMRLGAFTDLSLHSLEWTVEAVLHAAIFAPLAGVLFGLNLRDVGSYGLVNLVVFVALGLMSFLFGVVGM